MKIQKIRKIPSAMHNGISIYHLPIFEKNGSILMGEVYLRHIKRIKLKHFHSLIGFKMIFILKIKIMHG